MKFSVFGLDKILSSLSKKQEALKQTDKMMEEIGEIERQDIRQRIAFTKETPDGKKWAPWSPATLLARSKKRNVNRGLLFDSGNLLNSFRVIQKGKEVTIGTNVPYSIYLNNGTANMPARQFMGVSPKAKEKINLILKSKLGNL